MEAYSNFLKEMITVVDEVSLFISNHIEKVNPNDIETKEMNSLVSYVDKIAEEKIVEGLLKIIPNAGFITEEETENKKGEEYTFIIDPLDGTTNYLNKIPHYSISIALQKNEETIIGLVKSIPHDETWTAIKGNGAHLNGNKITVSNKSLHDSIVSTGFPYSNNLNYDAHFDVIKYWMTHCGGIRRMGSAAMDLCYVASGRFGTYYESTLNAWDVAAGILIVEEAGGIVSDFKGGDNYIFGGSIVASSPTVHQEVLDNIQKNLFPDDKKY